MIEKVEEHMEKAVSHLKDAVNPQAALPPALASEQSAYQALLKLAAHEYRVSQGRGSAAVVAKEPTAIGSTGMKQSQNRYETQRQAASPQNPEQREQLQVLNRLKELAQRQQDLNSRLKDLQTALQEAKTEQEREDLRRQLKRYAMKSAKCWRTSMNCASVWSSRKTSRAWLKRATTRTKPL